MGSKERDTQSAGQLLSWVALFLGELRDGLTMINMQSAFLIISKGYSEKQVGILFFVFGMSQFLFQTPAGYVMDYSDNKVMILAVAAVGTTIMTVSTASFAQEAGGNLVLMVVIKFFQGAITSLIPPGLNSITQGIVGSVGMTKQVSRNEMMNHLGTAIIVLSGSLTAFYLYPDIGWLFVVSPIACAGTIFNLLRINPDDIDHDAARGLTQESDVDIVMSTKSVSSVAKSVANSDKHTPSFNFGFGGNNTTESVSETPKADTPLQVLRDPILLLFTCICFLFHFANASVLPLVMQSLAIDNGKSGILMSGMCIIISQLVMVVTAKICGDYSRKYGRKYLFLIGFFTLPLRCLIITTLMSLEGEDGPGLTLRSLLLSTQVFDGIGAGTFGTMYILVTSDISGGTGRFSMVLGVTTAAMSIGSTASGYLGEMLAQDLGYRVAFIILGVISLVPALLYLFFMPETLPAYAQGNGEKTMDGIKEENEHEAGDATAGNTGEASTDYELV